jgi:hypothetical protein
MAGTTRRRLTRLDRELATKAARTADVRPTVRAFAGIALVGLFAYAVSVLVPDVEAFGGPLQGPVAGRASFAVFRKTEGGPVSLGLPVPWNAGNANVVLEGLQPLGADGVEVKRAGVVPPGSVAVEPQRGFPPPGMVLLPLKGYGVPPGVGDLDGFQVVVGLQGQGTIDAFALRYSMGGRRFVAILPVGAMLCAAGCQVRGEAEQAQRAAVARLVPFVEVADR